ncbi:MAG TPA: MoaD/ThiS family protein [Acidimicrobiales bacterium]|nr:MoaD/ThiS family protein [Acidimicrobiales bacterium]
MATVRFFAQARDAAGCANASVDGDTVAAVLEEATARFGGRLAQVIEISAIWVNGEFATPDQPVGAADEVAVLPPVSGG